jgi:hypothetical protein
VPFVFLGQTKVQQQDMGRFFWCAPADFSSKETGMTTCKLILPVLAAVESCDAVLTHRSAVDRGARPTNIAPGDFMQYVVRFTVSSLSCRDALHGYKSALR